MALFQMMSSGEGPLGLLPGAGRLGAVGAVGETAAVPKPEPLAVGGRKGGGGGLVPSGGLLGGGGGGVRRGSQPGAVGAVRETAAVPELDSGPGTLGPAAGGLDLGGKDGPGAEHEDHGQNGDQKGDFAGFHKTFQPFCIRGGWKGTGTGEGTVPSGPGQGLTFIV